MKKIILILLQIFLLNNVFSSSSGVTSVFDIGLNVKEQSLGGAYVAGENDTSSVFYNSACLYTLNKIELQGAYIPLLQDTKYNYIAAGLPTIDYGVFGISLARITTDNIITRDFNGLETGKENQELTEIIVGWGKDFFIENFLVGFNIKIDNQKIGNLNDSAFGMDAGLFYNLLIDIDNKINIGLNVKNLIQPDIKLLDNADKLPRQFITGINYKRNIFDNLKAELFFDISYSTDTDFEHREGLEVNFFNMFFLRAGNNSYNIFSLGAGICVFNMFYADYGVFFLDFETQHRFSFKIKMGDDYIVLREQKQKLEMEKIEKKAKEIAAQELKEMKKKMEDIKKKAAKDEYFKALHYTNGLEAYNQGDLKLADIELQIVYNIDSNYLNIKYYNDMIKNLKKNKGETYDKNIIKLYQQGVEKYLAGDYEGAKKEWTKILKIDPYNKLAIDNIKEVNELLRSIQKE